MVAIAYQITSLPVVNSIVYPDAGQRKHQSSASLAFVLEFPAQVASNAENVSIWWRHHGNCVWRCDCRLRERFDGFTKATNQSCHDDNFPPLMDLWIIMVPTYGVITDDKVGILTIIVLNILINIWYKIKIHMILVGFAVYEAKCSHFISVSRGRFGSRPLICVDLILFGLENNSLLTKLFTDYSFLIMHILNHHPIPYIWSRSWLPMPSLK